MERKESGEKNMGKSLSLEYSTNYLNSPDIVQL